MKKLLFLAAACLLGGMAAQAQMPDPIYGEGSEYEAIRKYEEQQRLEAIEDSLNYVRAMDALERMDFVVEADQLMFKWGRTAFVNTATNFVSVHDGEATIQIAPFNAGGGPNGVGGITVTGTPSNVKVKTNKRGNTYFSMNVNGPGVSATVSLKMARGSNQVTLTVSPNFNSNNVTLMGELLPTAFSNVYKGRSL